MNKTAVILFANLPEFEARAKSFSNYSSQKATQQISRVLTQHFYQLAKNSSADAFLIDSNLQKGKNFAERITNAFDATYAKGYENVICIGNDCPSLTLNKLENAVNQIEKGKIVLGPTVDGGAYLIGLPEKHFNKKVFSTIKWQSSKTYEALKNIFKTESDAILETEKLVDIDDIKDFQKLNSSNHALLRLISQIITNFLVPISKKINQFQNDFIRVDFSSLKSPPAFSIYNLK